ncbi:MAG: hypothetical protein KDH96_08610 [Candidatus Riesia sp.]|nr:hypothetical protein [Candidatus Riesia sp.]
MNKKPGSYANISQGRLSTRKTRVWFKHPNLKRFLPTHASVNDEGITKSADRLLLDVVGDAKSAKQRVAELKEKGLLK